ncbi:DUF2207 domain-containing protein [Kribbella deserti]|uniref:DUF2207 domain-containing protein n=1 Tax=Kribbella deserti TaxID=1926257 RepID=A0ABV6QPZ2_9ACTN
MGLRLSALLAVITLVGAGAQVPVVAVAAPAWEPDRVERIAVAYEVGSDGVLRVTERIDYLHGDGELLRRFMVRWPNPSDDSTDRVLQIQNITLESPTGGDTRLHQQSYDPNDNTDDSSYDSREEVLDLIVGRDVPTGRRDTYVLKYELRGALEQAGDGIRFAVSGPGQKMKASALSLTVSAPRGVRSADCEWAGKRFASAELANGVGQFANPQWSEQLEYTAGLRSLSCTIGLVPGAVQNVGPILDDPPRLRPNAMTTIYILFWIGLAVMLVVLIAAAILIIRYEHRRRSAASRASASPGTGF